MSLGYQMTILITSYVLMKGSPASWAANRTSYHEKDGYDAKLLQ